VTARPAAVSGPSGTQFLFGHASGKIKQMISVSRDTLWNVTQQFLQSIGCTHAQDDIVFSEHFNDH